MNQDAVQASLDVKVIPRASRDELVGFRGDRLCIKLRAPPVKGAANAALIEYVADLLCVGRGSVRIKYGHRTRLKSLRVTGLSNEELQMRLARRLRES